MNKINYPEEEQVKTLNTRIAQVIELLQKNKRNELNRRELLKLVGQRRGLINCLNKKKVEAYLNKQQTLQKELCLSLRKILFKIYPKIKEEIKWGVISYDNGMYYIGVVKHGVNFGFSMNGLSNNDIKKFNGNGKTMRNIKIKKIEDINEKELTKLIKLVHSNSNYIYN